MVTVMALAESFPNSRPKLAAVAETPAVSGIADIIADIKNGKRPTAHFVQLYWLLTSFFSACAEVGAAGDLFGIQPCEIFATNLYERLERTEK